MPPEPAPVRLRRSWRARFWHVLANVIYAPHERILWPLGAAVDRLDRAVCRAYGWAEGHAWEKEDHDGIPF